MGRILNKHNLIVLGAIAANLASTEATPVEDNTPLLIKNEITHSTIANKAGASASKGGTSEGNSFLGEGKKFEFEKTDLIAGMQKARVPLSKMAKFFQSYNGYLDKDGKITSQAMGKSARNAQIDTAQYTTIVETLKQIDRTRKLDKLDRVSRAGAKGYDYFEQPLGFKIDDKGDIQFVTNIVIRDSETYLQDLENINRAIEKTRKIDNDTLNIEAAALINKSYACSEVRKMIEGGRDIPNSDKLLDSFEKDLDGYNLKIGDDGKVRKDVKTISLNPTLALFNTNRYRSTG